MLTRLSLGLALHTVPGLPSSGNEEFASLGLESHTPADGVAYLPPGGADAWCDLFSLVASVM